MRDLNMKSALKTKAIYTKQGDNCFLSLFLLFFLSSLFFPSLYILLLLTNSVPPIVVPLDADQEVIGNETENATLSFRIDDATPPVLLQDLRWFYAANFSSDPSVRQDITNLTSRTTSSRLTFSEFTNMRYISLTVSNITQRRSGIGGETDEGRYFLFATNPAGVAFSYIDLVVFGMYFQFLGCQPFNVVIMCMCVCLLYV